MATCLVTGVAGFIANATATQLLAKGHTVIGLDNLNDYYDTRVKKWRLGLLKGKKNFSFYKTDIEALPALKKIFSKHNIDAVINLAARAGVRYSMEHPHVYFTTNVLGTINLLELCKDHNVKKFVLASTSSLYAGQKMPFKENLAVNAPISPYAASKKSAEASCHAWHFLYNIDISIVRYFTVYGPGGRPDMSILIFIKKIDEGLPIDVFGDGTQSRDFSYVDDIADGTIRALRPNPSGYEVFNLGNNDPFKLNHAIALIEKYLGKKATVIHKPFHKADVMATWANIDKAATVLKWKPKTNLETGIRRTVAWYLENRKWLKNITL